MLLKPIFFYNNLLKKYPITVTNEGTAYPIENICDDNIQTIWESPYTTAFNYIKIDAGLLASDDAEDTSASVVMTMRKSITLTQGGEFLIEFDIRRLGDPAGDKVYGQIYRNGSPVGTLQSTTSTAYQTFTEKISGWSVGDAVELWVKTDYNMDTCYIRNFRINGALTADIFCLGPKHNLASANAYIQLQYSNDNFVADINSLNVIDEPADNSYQYEIFNPVSARYFRIKIGGSPFPLSELPQIGEVAFGSRLDLSRNFSDSFDDRAKKIERKVNVSDGGQQEAITKFKRRYFPCTLDDIRFDSQEETDIFAWRDAIEDGMPFWFLWDPGSGIRDILFVTATFSGDNLKSKIKGEYRDFEFTLEEEL